MSTPQSREGQSASAPNERILKSLGPKAVRIEEGKQGGTAIVASLGEIDLHGDIILPGALENPGERIAVLDSHGWADTSRYGVATLQEKNGKIEASFELFTESDKGKHFYDALKKMGEDQEWSIGLRLIETAWVVRDSEEYREIRKMIVDEISAVTRGAQPNTGTTSIKAAEWQRELGELREKVEAQAAEIETLKTAPASDPPSDPSVTDPPVTDPPATGDSDEVATKALGKITEVAEAVKSLTESVTSLMEKMGTDYGKALEELTNVAKSLGGLIEKTETVPPADPSGGDPGASDPPADPPANPDPDPDPETPERKALRERLRRHTDSFLR